MARAATATKPRLHDDVSPETETHADTPPVAEVVVGDFTLTPQNAAANAAPETRGRRLSDGEKQQIIALHHAGKNNSAIAAEVGCTFATVVRVLEKAGLGHSPSAKATRVPTGPIWSETKERFCTWAASVLLNVDPQHLMHDEVDANETTELRNLLVEKVAAARKKAVADALASI